ncbi:MAG TPA: hypothetical protein IAA15_07845 [Candidatus Olsenella pullicola]|nr:hypothetical protein [Candidatus Olsenella pullicola]
MSSNLGTLNDVLFEEIRNVMSVDMTDDEAVEREIKRAETVTRLAQATISNANTVLHAVRARDGLMDAKAPMPKMLGV